MPALVRPKYGRPRGLEALAFVVIFLISLGFILPALFSAQDTLLVLCGVLWCVALAIWLYSICRRAALWFDYSSTVKETTR